MSDDPRRVYLRRPMLRPNGKIVMVDLRVCIHGTAARGPAGGVCGLCGGAIPKLLAAVRGKKN